MKYAKERSLTSLTFEYRVVLLRLRNVILISSSGGLSYVDFWDIQERQLDTTFTTLKNIRYYEMGRLLGRRVSIEKRLCE